MLRSVPTAPQMCLSDPWLIYHCSFEGHHLSTQPSLLSLGQTFRKKARKMARAECVHSGMFSCSPKMVPNKDYELALKNTSNES